MIELIYSNKTERLLDNLAVSLREQRKAGAHPLDPVELVVPNRNMETWVRLGLAQAAGVAANLNFRRIERFIGEIITETCPGEYKPVNLDIVEAAILATLLNRDIIGEPELKPVRKYLDSTVQLADILPGVDILEDQSAFDKHLAADGADIRRVQLASRIAALFQEYTFSRPEMIAAWRDGGSEIAGHPFADPSAADPTLAPTVAWQRALWRAVFGRDGVLEQNPPADGGRWTTLDLLAFDDDLFKRVNEIGLPPVHVFGVSYVARLFQHFFARLGEAGTLKIYTLNPCAEFWEDVETDREYSRRLDREFERRSKRVWAGTGETENEDPFGLFEADTPALRFWGRPGREHVRLLGELTDCDFTGAFADPGDMVSLLHQLQRDILLREPERTLEMMPDETIKLVAAPSVRREVEWVADEIWKLMRDDQPSAEQQPLRFSDIAVIVNSAERDLYLPQIETVFAACQGLPGSVSDLPGTAGSKLLEAMSLLLKLPFGRFSRAEMLALLSHPAVIGRFDDLNPGELAARAEALGIVYGADHSDHSGTYIDEDVYNWDQGVRRLALGAFMTGDKSGDERIFETSGGRWLVEEVSGSAVSAAARFGLLTRALIADARFVRKQKMTFSDWARFYTVQIDAYLHIENGTDERDRLRLLRSLARLEAMDLGALVSGRVAAEIASKAIESLSGSRGQYLAEGVVVSSFLPMRAIPFRVVFLLGLGEGHFPASGRRDALDLRAARRRAGDVDTSERDRYMFLETLLCTREKLYLSYVRRDEQTGDPLQPSAVVQELMHMLQHGYLGEEGVQALRIEPPLRRFDEQFAERETFLDEARVEAKVQEVARDWQAHAHLTAGTGNELEAIRRAVDPKSWAKLADMLTLPGEPPATISVTATPKGYPLDTEVAVEAPIALSLSAIRRFLECPMQGWASAMLGLAEMDEDLADREEEDFDVNRLTEITLLRDVFLTAAASGLDPEILYRNRSARMRLAGQIPVGALGKVIERRHITILSGWQTLVEEFAGKGNMVAGGTLNSPLLQRVRLGRPSRQCATEKVLDPLALSLELGGVEGQNHILPLRISGLTEGLLESPLVSITFQPTKPPADSGRGSLGRIFRHFLRGIVDQTLLSAVNAAGTGERQILVCYAGGETETGIISMRLRPPDVEKARSWLTAVTADLLGEPHAYLMPVEAVVLEYYDRLLALNGGKKGEKGSLLPAASAKEIGPLLDGVNIRRQVSILADGEWTRFSSLWGPVPSPRTYEPPPAEEAARMAARRFGPLFDDIISLEVLR
jgi:exodeoxyribonuclease V gamma subunit